METRKKNLISPGKKWGKDVPKPVKTLISPVLGTKPINTQVLKIVIFCMALAD
jgi:hypothetical protein